MLFIFLFCQWASCSLTLSTSLLLSNTAEEPMEASMYTHPIFRAIVVIIALIVAQFGIAQTASAEQGSASPQTCQILSGAVSGDLPEEEVSVSWDAPNCPSVNWFRVTYVPEPGATEIPVSNPIQADLRNVPYVFSHIEPQSPLTGQWFVEVREGSPTGEMTQKFGPLCLENICGPTAVSLSGFSAKSQQNPVQWVAGFIGLVVVANWLRRK